MRPGRRGSPRTTPAGFTPPTPPRCATRSCAQISGTVRWVDNMRALAERATRIVEIGPGKPLSGFFKDIGVTVQAITDLAGAREAAS